MTVFRVRMAGVRAASAGLALTMLLAPAARADGITIRTYPVQDQRLDLGSVAFAGGRTLHLHQGIGSGAFHPPGAPLGSFVTVGDRGPNFTCGEALEITGVDGKTLCGGAKHGRIYPTPDYSPSIYRIEVEDEAVRLVDIIKLKDAAGRPINGMPNPLSVASTEQPFDAQGKPLPRSAAALDVEGIVALKDGTYWIGEENAPSILHVAADGRILKRFVPAGTAGDFSAAGYPVADTLPSILARRQANRGIESMAVAPDESFLYFVLQNPLANPDAATFKQAGNTRLFKIDPASGRAVAEYVYELTPMSAFKGEEKKAPSTARISELLAVDGHRFLIDDRTDKTTRIFEIDLEGATDILNGRFDDPATRPTLEQVSLAEAGIRPVGKRPVLDSSAYPQLPAKIEGMAFFDGTSASPLMLINDDDFGIGGEKTSLMRIEGLPIER